MFIEFNLQENGLKNETEILVNVNKIESVTKKESGGSYVWLSGDGKLIVKESYDNIKQRLFNFKTK